MDTDGRGEGWRRERLFSAVAELLAAVAGRSPVGLVIEDVHWADSATLDCLTYLARVGDGGAVTVVATCRSGRVHPDQHVLIPDGRFGDLLHSEDVRGTVVVLDDRLHRRHGSAAYTCGEARGRCLRGHGFSR